MLMRSLFSKSAGGFAMDVKRQAVLDAAMALPEADRVAIIQHLLATLSPEGDGPLEEEWAADLDRRLADFEDDPTTAVPWAELKHQN
jgi:putative addiction module component (TIGR02574 family)